MKEHPATRHADRCPTHPGEVLRDDVLPALGVSVAAFARAIGVSRQTVHAILSGDKGITPAMALRIGKFVGNGPGLWLRMQQAYDLWVAERALAQTLAGIETHRAA
jgi:addiction module HigA family antidote